MASPNSISLATKFLPIMDEIYARESLTARMDAPTKPIDFVDAKTVKIFKIGLVGLGNYDRVNGYPTGAMSGTWETMTLGQDRAREFDVDREDDEESLNQAFGRLVGEFIRTKVIPEIDAYRFATYAAWSGVGSVPATTLSNTTTVAAIDAAMLAMDDAEVPSEGRILFASSTVYAYLKQQITRLIANGQSNVDRTIEMFDRVEIVRVPQARFYSAISLYTGADPAVGGFLKTGHNMQFLLVHPSAVLQATKIAMPKIFSPDENQSMDAWKFQYRHYHDAFVYDNKVAGVYAHSAAA